MKVSPNIIRMMNKNFSKYPELCMSVFDVLVKFQQNPDDDFDHNIVRHLCWRLSVLPSTEEGEQFWSAIYGFITEFNGDVILTDEDLVVIALNNMDYNEVRNTLIDNT